MVYSQVRFRFDYPDEDCYRLIDPLLLEDLKLAQSKEPILVRCTCGHAFRSSDLVQGRKVRCPHCKKKWLMSQTAVEAALKMKAQHGGAVELKQFSGKGSTAGKVLDVLSQQDDAEQDLMVTCAFCHDPIAPDAPFCPNCGFAQQVADTSGGPRKASKALILLSFSNMLVKPFGTLIETLFRTSFGLALTAIILIGAAVGGWYGFSVLGQATDTRDKLVAVQLQTEGTIRALLDQTLNNATAAARVAFGAGEPFPKTFSKDLEWDMVALTTEVPRTLKFTIFCYKGDKVTGTLDTKDRTVIFSGSFRNPILGMLDFRGEMDLEKRQASAKTEIDGTKIKVYTGYKDRKSRWDIKGAPINIDENQTPTTP